VKVIDEHSGHLARNSENAIRVRLDARGSRTGVEMASGAGEGGDG